MNEEEALLKKTGNIRIISNDKMSVSLLMNNDIFITETKLYFYFTVQ